MSNHLLSHYCETCRKTKRMSQRNGVLHCPRCHAEKPAPHRPVPDLPITPRLYSREK